MTALKDQLRLEIEDTPARNLQPNPNGEDGTEEWWWSTYPSIANGAGSFVADTTGVPIAVNGASFKLTPTTTARSAIVNRRQRVIPGEYVGAAATFWRPSGSPGTVTADIFIRFDAYPFGLIAGSLTSRGSVAVPVNSATTLTIAPFVVPAGADRMTIYVAVTQTTAHAMHVSKIVMNLDDVSADAAAVWMAPTFQEVIGDSISVEFAQGNVLDGVEDKIEAGLLTAVVKDATIDPAVNDEIYRGRLVRLSALNGSTWESQYEGKIEALNTDYVDAQTIVTVTATDAGGVLNSTQLGTCGTASLEDVLGSDIADATGLKTDDGAGNTPADSNLEATLDGSTAADWLRRACNTFGGYAWVDKRSVVQARSAANLPTTSTTFSDSLSDVGATYYTAIDPATSTEAIVNNLLVERINVAELEGRKEYGPYQARSSVRKWKIVDAKVEVLDGTPLTIATDLLEIFATPMIFPRSVTFNATADISKATQLSLYQKALVKLSGVLNDSFRIIKLSHQILAGGNNGERWIVTAYMRPLETGHPAVTVMEPLLGPLSGPSDLAAYSTRDKNGVVALASGSGAVNSTVTFSKPFPPGMIPAITVTSKNLELHTPRITSASETAFTVRWDRSSTGAYGYNWQAQAQTP